MLLGGLGRVTWFGGCGFGDFVVLVWMVIWLGGNLVSGVGLRC